MDLSNKIYWVIGFVLLAIVFLWIAWLAGLLDFVSRSCRADGDCVSSCTHGCVSRNSFYREALQCEYLPECGCVRGECAVGGEAPVVSIQTDKPSYLKGEEAHLTVSNPLNEPIYLVECRPLQQERWVVLYRDEMEVNGVWEYAGASPLCSETRLWEMKAGSEEKHILYPRPASTGSHRVKLEARLRCGEYISQHGTALTGTPDRKICGVTLDVYSNVFEVGG